MRPNVPDVHITDSQDAELAKYRPLSGLAIFGLILGFLAPLAMADPVFWLLPVPGVIVNWVALRRIKIASPPMTGRKLALCGAALSLVFLAAAPADWLLYRKMVRDEARQFAGLWFRYLAQDEPYKAHQLVLGPRVRGPMNALLKSHYRRNEKLSDQLEAYVNSVPTRTLLALGPRAQVRFYETVEQTREGNLDKIGQCYAVTYEEQGEKKTFFVLLRLARWELDRHRAAWRVMEAQDGFRPKG